MKTGEKRNNHCALAKKIANLLTIYFVFHLWYFEFVSFHFPHPPSRSPVGGNFGPSTKAADSDSRCSSQSDGPFTLFCSGQQLQEEIRSALIAISPSSAAAWRATRPAYQQKRHGAIAVSLIRPCRVLRWRGYPHRHVSTDLPCAGGRRC